MPNTKKGRLTFKIAKGTREEISITHIKYDKRNEQGIATIAPRIGTKIPKAINKGVGGKTAILDNKEMTEK